ncbi:MAG: Bax inhibitor-1/YccA family protein [Candidatus Delongbacteria bacterium]|nr:Bax inhibitor-1/YccA family protein [Candidatus Delongbacteria bacterium]MBN2834110.1 Bax inhibitor-1/YccA family protein [Candidatus Delongbacteria bacterium]
MDIKSLQNISVADEQRSFMTKVYGWMLAALLVTALTAVITIRSETLLLGIVQSPMFYVLIFAELGLVFYFSARVHKMSITTATMVFMLYSVLNGMTLSVILLVYSIGVIYNAFLTSALTFGAMSVYGYVTKKDLTSWGSFFMMGLFGIIIASVLNFFIASTMIDGLITYLGVFIFLGLTAYDTQKLKKMYYQGADEESVSKYALLGALTLYLDFINLFLMLLRLFGRGRD